MKAPAKTVPRPSGQLIFLIKEMQNVSVENDCKKFFRIKMETFGSGLIIMVQSILMDTAYPITPLNEDSRVDKLLVSQKTL